MNALPVLLAVAALVVSMLNPWGTLVRNDRVLVLGLSGSGKTFQAKRLIAEARRVVIFDPCRDYRGEGEEVSADDLANYPELLVGPFVRVVVRAEGEDGQELAEELASTVAAARNAQNLVFVADEVGDYGREAEKPLTRLFRNGRHDGIACVFVTQAATEIPKGCRRQATRCVSLLQSHHDDLAELEKWFGPEFSARVAKWQPGEPPVTWELPTLYHSRRIAT